MLSASNISQSYNPRASRASGWLLIYLRMSCGMNAGSIKNEDGSKYMRCMLRRQFLKPMMNHARVEIPSTGLAFCCQQGSPQLATDTVAVRCG